MSSSDTSSTYSYLEISASTNGSTTLSYSDFEGFMNSNLWPDADVVELTLTGFKVIPDNFFSYIADNFNNTVNNNLNILNITGTTELTIGKGAFYKSNLVNVSFPPAAKIVIDDGAFCYCSYLQSINLENVTSIGRFAFYYNMCLCDVNLTGLDTSDVHNLGNGAFYNCASLGIVAISPAFYSKTHHSGGSNLIFEVDVDAFKYYGWDYVYSNTDTVPDKYELAFGFKCDNEPPGVPFAQEYTADTTLNSTLFDQIGQFYKNTLLAEFAYWISTGSGIPGNTYTVNQMIDNADSSALDNWEYKHSGSVRAPQLWLLKYVHINYGEKEIQSWASSYKSNKDYYTPVVNNQAIPAPILKNLQAIYQFQFYHLWDTVTTGTTDEASATDIDTYYQSYNAAISSNEPFAGGVCKQYAGSLSLAFASNITKITGSFQNVLAGTVHFPNIDMSTCSFEGNTTIQDFVFEYGYDASASIPASFFSGCTSLKYITFPSYITTIGANAFSGCTSFIGSERSGLLNLQHVTQIGTTGSSQSDGSSFANCSSILGVLLSPDLSVLGPYSFSGCTTLLLEEDTFPISSTFTHLQPYTFQNCTAVNTLTIPPTIDIVGSYCFSGCSGIESIYFNTNTGPGLTIGQNAFACAATVPYINLPPSIASIGANAFYGMKLSVLSMSINYFITPTYSNSSTNQSLGDLTTPSTASDAEGYSKWMYDTFGPPFGTELSEKDNLFNLPNGVKIELYYTFGKKPDSTFNMTTLTREDVVYWLNEWELSRVFSAGDFNAFVDPAITSIGDEAFSNCHNLVTMSIHIGVTTIGNKAFSYCDQLSNLFFGTNLNAVGLSNLETIGDYAFEGCSMKQILLPPNVSSIGRWCFYNSQKLSNIIFFRGSNIDTIEDYCFANCSNLTSFKFPSSVTVIGDAAFRNCSSLERLMLPPTLVSIGEDAFKSCTYISSARLPSTVNYIGKDAFANTPVSMTPTEADPPSGLAVVPYHDKVNSLSGSVNNLMSSMTSNPAADCTNGTYKNVSISSATGVGSGAVATVKVSENVITSLLLSSTGSNYEIGDELFIAAGDLGSSSSKRDFKLQSANIVGTLAPLLQIENSLMFSLVASTNTTGDCQDGTYDNVVISNKTGNGEGARATVKVVGNVVTSVTVTTPGKNYSVGDVIQIASGVLGLISTAREFTITLHNIDADVITPATVGNYFNAPSISDPQKLTLLDDYNTAVYNYNYTLWLRDSLTPIYNSDMGSYWSLYDRLYSYNSNHNDMFPNDYKSFVNKIVAYSGQEAKALSTAKTFLTPDSSGSNQINQWVDGAYFTMKSAKMLLDSDPPVISPIPNNQVRFSFTFSASSSNGVLTTSDILKLLPSSLHKITPNNEGSFNGFVASFDDTVTSIGSYAFQNLPVYSITSFNKVTSIGDYAFYQCITLKGMLSFPYTLETIGNSSFQGTCINTVYFVTAYDTTTPSNPGVFRELLGVKTIGSNAFKNAFLANSTISFPKTITDFNSSIGSDAFGELMSPFSSPSTPCLCKVSFDVSQHDVLAANYTNFISVGASSSSLPSYSYSGFLSNSLDSPTTIQSGATSAPIVVDLATYMVTSATLQGGYINTATSAYAYRVPGSSSTYILAANDGGYTKMVQVELTNENGNIYAAAEKAGNVNSLGDKISDNTSVVEAFLGSSLQNESVASSASAPGYGVSSIEISKISYPWANSSTNGAVTVSYSAMFEPAAPLQSIIAMGNGTSSIYSSTDGGEKWTGVPFDKDPFANGTGFSVASDGHKFWAVGQSFMQSSNGGGPGAYFPQLAVSVDLGKTWIGSYVEKTYNTSANVFAANDNSPSGGDNGPINYGALKSIAYSVSDNIWIAGGSNGNSQATLGYSTNGGWPMIAVDISSFNLSSVNCIACGTNIAVVGCSGGSGTSNILYSVSSPKTISSAAKVLGQEWKHVNTNIGSSSEITSIVYNGSMWVATAMDSCTYYSPDGMTWAQGVFSYIGAGSTWNSLNDLLQASDSALKNTQLNITTVSWNGYEFVAKAGEYQDFYNNPNVNPNDAPPTSVTDVYSQDGMTWYLPANIALWGDTSQNQAFMATIWSGSNWISVGFNSLPVYSSGSQGNSVTWTTGTNTDESTNGEGYMSLFCIATVHALPYNQAFAIENGSITQEIVNNTLPSAFKYDPDNLPTINNTPVVVYVGPRTYDVSVTPYASMPISIDTAAFSNTTITSVILDNVSYIGENAFAGCHSLRTVDLSYNTTYIEPGALIGTTLKSCRVPVGAASMINSTTVPRNCKASYHVIFTKPEDGVLTEVDVDLQLSMLNSQFYGYIIAYFDPTVTIISNNAFQGNKYICQVVISPFIESISQNAFKECPNLVNVTTWQGGSSIDITPNLVYIGKDAFNGNSKLVAVTLPSSLDDIEPGAFLGCSNLWQVQLPSRFYYGNFVMYNIYFESNMMKNETWKSDAQWSAGGTFFTFNFQENGQNAFSYSWAKQNYMAQQRQIQAEKVAAHVAYEHSAFSFTHIMEDIGVVAAAGLGAVYLAPVLMTYGGAALASTADLVSVGFFSWGKDAVSDAADGAAEGAGSDAVGQATSNSNAIPTDDYIPQPGETGMTKNNVITTEIENTQKEGSELFLNVDQVKEALGTAGDHSRSAKALRNWFYTGNSYNRARFGMGYVDQYASKAKRFLELLHYAPNSIMPDDFIDVMSNNVTKTEMWPEGDPYSLREIRKVLMNRLVRIGAISQDDAKVWLSAGDKDYIKRVITARNVQIAASIDGAETSAGKYAQSFYKPYGVSNMMRDYKATCEYNFSQNFWLGASVMLSAMPAWDYAFKSYHYSQYPAMQNVSTTALSEQLALTNNYGNMGSIYGTPSSLAPIPSSYTSHTAGSWVVTTDITYSPEIQVNLYPLLTAFKDAAKQVLGAATFNRADTSYTHSTTKKSYNKITFKLTMVRDYESVTEQEKSSLTKAIDDSLNNELAQYNQPEDSDVTTTTTTTPPNNPAIYPQLLGGGPSAGYSPKLVLLSEGGADRARSRFMLRTGWNNATDSLNGNNTSSFSSVNNTGNKNFVRDSSNFIKYRKLRAINQNYNDLKK